MVYTSMGYGVCVKDRDQIHILLGFFIGQDNENVGSFRIKVVERQKTGEKINHNKEAFKNSFIIISEE
jgi:hypothetical protein